MTYFALKGIEQEKKRIFRALEQTNRNKDAVIRLLNVGRTHSIGRCWDMERCNLHNTIFRFDTKVLSAISLLGFLLLLLHQDE